MASAVGTEAISRMPQPRRGGRGSGIMSVAPSGATDVDAVFRPTAHAVGYSLPPLRDSQRFHNLGNAHAGDAPPLQCLAHFPAPRPALHPS
jgi:hypothetical protein